MAPAAHPADRDAIAIGDSVMLGAKGPLLERGFVVDAQKNRQASVGPDLLVGQGSQLPRNVVVHLGTNGTYSLDQCRELVDTAGQKRRVFLVTVHVDRPWAKPNNKVLRACDAAYRADRVQVIDWDWAATRHPGWLYSDGTHLRPEGATAFARIMDEAITRAATSAQ